MNVLLQLFLMYYVLWAIYGFFYFVQEEHNHDLDSRFPLDGKYLFYKNINFPAILITSIIVYIVFHSIKDEMTLFIIFCVWASFIYLLNTIGGAIYKNYMNNNITKYLKW